MDCARRRRESRTERWGGIRKATTLATIGVALLFVGSHLGGCSGGGIGGSPGPDTTAPAEVSSFSATPGDAHILLTWANPADADFAGIMIRCSTVSFPASITDGTEIYNSNSTSVDHVSLTNGVVYYYTAFTYDATPNYSTGAQISSAPAPATQVNISAADWGWAIETDPSGNVFVAGTTEGRLDGNGEFGRTDLFVIKYNSAGVRQWTRQAGNSSWDDASGLATDTAGNVYVVGQTGAALDGQTFVGSQNLFVIKYNASGTRQWTRLLGTNQSLWAWDVATDTGDNVYVTGHTNGVLDGNVSAGSDDFYLVKYDSAGTRQWTRQFGSAGDDQARGVATDTLDNIYVIGVTGGDLDGNTNSGFEDIFVVKYDSAGNRQWTRLLGSTYDLNEGLGGEAAYAVATDNTNNVYVVGNTNSHMDGNTNALAGREDIFLVKYDSSGVKQWTRQAGSTEADYAHGVAVDSAGNVIVTGFTAGDLDGNVTSGVADIFVIQYNSSGVKQWTRQTGTTQWEYGRGAATDSDGNIYIGGYTSGGLGGNSNYGLEDLFAMKLNSAGTILWTQQFGTYVEVPTGSPTAPTGLTASAPSNFQSDLVWTDTSNNESGYRIERKPGPGGTWSEIASVGPNIVSYSDSFALMGQYYYRVRAYNATGNSAYCAELSMPRINLQSNTISDDAPDGTAISVLSGIGFAGPTTVGIIGGAASVFRVTGSTLELWQSKYIDYKSYGEYRVIASSNDSSYSIDQSVRILVAKTPYIKIDSSPMADVNGRPAIATYGQNFFVVYRDETTGSSEYRGCRITSAGQNLDPGGILMGTRAVTGYGYFPGVAFNGSDFLTVWVDPGGEIFGSRVDTAGTLLTANPIQITTGAASKIRPASIAFDGTNYLLVWRDTIDDIKVALVSTTGSIIGNPAGITIGSGFYPWVATNGTNYLVIWHFNGASDLDIKGNRVSFAGSALDGSGFIISSDTLEQSHASITSDGTNYFVVWHDYRFSGTAYGARVTGGGVVMDNPAVQISAESYGVGGVAYDGTDYMVVFQLDRGASQLIDVAGQKISTGAVLVGSQIAISSARGHQAGAKVAYNTNNYFIAWTEVGPYLRDTGVWGYLVPK